MTKRVLLALSGGVDSSVCAHLLRQQGYEVEAAVIDFSPAHGATVAAARQAAKQLDLPLHIIDGHAAFERNVIEPFCQQYRAGRTPNPCIFCNPSTKFALMCQKAKELGIPKIATGHYAGLLETEQGYFIRRSACLERDQSYMLYRLSQEQLSMLLLPLEKLAQEGLGKAGVRQLAAQLGLDCADAPDSQEICFIPDNDYAAYIEGRYGPCAPGPILDPEGKVCGEHQGLLHYTVGQRKHLGIALGYPVFVKALDAQRNSVILARAGEEFAPGVRLEELLRFPHPAWQEEPLRALVKIRSRAPLCPATITPLEQGALVRFETPQRAPAPGQSCVLYSEEGIVLGGGSILEQLAL